MKRWRGLLSFRWNWKTCQLGFGCRLGLKFSTSTLNFPVQTTFHRSLEDLQHGRTWHELDLLREKTFSLGTNPGPFCDIYNIMLCNHVQPAVVATGYGWRDSQHASVPYLGLSDPLQLHECCLRWARICSHWLETSKLKGVIQWVT